jgi:hypothetical protein
MESATVAGLINPRRVNVPEAAGVEASSSVESEPELGGVVGGFVGWLGTVGLERFLLLRLRA